MKSGDGLRAAHAGYVYQDLLAAYVLGLSLVHRYQSVTIDRKNFAGDVFDDIAIRYADGRSMRCQVKSSLDPGRALKRSDLTATASSLRLDYLVATAREAEQAGVSEYRLLTTWSGPDDSLAPFIAPATDAPVFENAPGRRYRLLGERIWPKNDSIAWTLADGHSRFSRAELLAFCDRFVIELALPPASTDLDQPGLFEQAVIALLTDRIGIGQYPNHSREPRDVASLLVHKATLARSAAGSLTPSDVEAALQLRTDYGRVAQQFPLDTRVLQDRVVVRETLLARALDGVHQIVTGPPGSGKSWTLTQLAADLKDRGAVVTRHYCYLEPGDPLVAQRITRDALFGNLMAELTDSLPVLRDAPTRVYAANLTGLEDMLHAAGRLGSPVVLIVDGLDHIARVLSGAPGVRDSEADIVEQLASLQLPEGVALVLGSQPGPHLEPLRQAYSPNIVDETVPAWAFEEIEQLTRCIGVGDALGAIGIADISETITALSGQADGNPLYATYLSRELVRRAVDGEVSSAEDWLRSLPGPTGDLAAYYSHLYQTGLQAERAILDVLGVIEFGVTETELGEILAGPLRNYVTNALRKLTPLLTDVASQGGYRIFHESFRRFLQEELQRQNRSVAHALEPVIAWLTELGFFRDTRSYRFLLPALRRAGRDTDVLDHIDVSFVANSVAYGHPRNALTQNLDLALDTAARSLRWPDMVRIVELNRAAYTCFEDKLLDPLPYWHTYVELFGGTALANRLLFDGRPVQPRRIGLACCSLADDAGAIAPWSEYLDLRELPLEDTAQPAPGDQLTDDDQESLAEFHGVLRLDDAEDVALRFRDFLRQFTSDPVPIAFIRSLAERYARVRNAAVLQDLIADLTRSDCGRDPLAPSAICALSLGLATACRREGSPERAAAAADRALRVAETAPVALECIEYGADPRIAQEGAVALASLPLGLEPDSRFPGRESVQMWVASVRLMAYREGDSLTVEAARLAGEGWYRCWLRYVLAMAQADAARRRGHAGPRPADAFRELRRDVRPFRKPAVQDLFEIRPLIADSLKWGLSRLDSLDDWQEAIQTLKEVLEGTSISFRRDESGPVSIRTVLFLLAPYASRDDVGPLIRDFAEMLVHDGEEHGTYFETHAERSMALAQLLHAGGNRSSALEEWRRVSTYLASYGWRKDVTIFDLLQSIPALGADSRHAAMDALVAAQPLAEAMLRHTDGRSTRDAPLSWFRSLITCAPETGCALLTHSMLVRDAPFAGWLDDALRIVLELSISHSNPRVLNALYDTLPLDGRYVEEILEELDLRLTAFGRLPRLDGQDSGAEWSRLAAHVINDGREHFPAAWDRLRRYADDHGRRLPDTAMPTVPPTMAPDRFVSWQRVRPEEAIERGMHSPIFPANSQAADLIGGIRRAARYRLNHEQREWDRFTLALGYRLWERLANQPDSAEVEDDVVRLLRFATRELRATILPQGVNPVADLATGLERAGYTAIAGIAYALAYSAGRGGGGYYAVGDGEHAPLLMRAVTLNRAAALDVLASEVAYTLRDATYQTGITRALVERPVDWGEPALAKENWWAALAVISRRLPIESDHIGWLERLNPSQLPEWSIDEALAALLLAQVQSPILTRKNAALTGLGGILRHCSEVLCRPFAWVLTRDASVTSVELLLQLLLEAEDAPYVVTRANAEVLRDYMQSDLWHVGLLAQIALERADIPVTRVVRVGAAKLDPPVSSERTEVLLSADVGDRLSEIAAVWPDLPALSARRLNVLIGDRRHYQSAIKERLELATDRRLDDYPGTAVLGWDTELLEVAVGEVLNGLSAHRAQCGQFDERVDLDVLKRLMPDMIAHAGIVASRVPRPAYPAAETIATGRSAVHFLHSEHDAFDGWARIAYVERHWARNSQHPYTSERKITTVLAGIVCQRLGTRSSDDAIPFTSAGIEDWWAIPAEPNFPARLPCGPQCGLVRLRDWLGDILVPIPPLGLRSYVSLDPPSFGDPLAWRDRTGAPMLILRSWRVRDTRGGSVEPYDTIGSDILVEPALYGRLQSLTSGSIIEQRYVITEERP